MKEVDENIIYKMPADLMMKIQFLEGDLQFIKSKPSSAEKKEMYNNVVDSFYIKLDLYLNEIQRILKFSDPYDDEDILMDIRTELRKNLLDVNSKKYSQDVFNLIYYKISNDYTDIFNFIYE